MNKKTGKDFDIAHSISRQLPFFTCINIALNKEYQKDISRYVYCTKFNTPAYSGSYGQQPSKWVHKISIIQSSIEKLKQKHKTNNKS